MSSQSEDNAPVVLNPPKHIYLCFGEIDEDTEYSQLWHAHDDVLWCTDPQDASDIQYILASEVEALRTELARVTAERDGLKKIVDEAIWNGFLAIDGVMVKAAAPESEPPQ